MAPRVRAAASACLVASGLLISGVGGAIALADPGRGHQDDRKSSDDRKGSDSRSGEDSVGDIVRRAFEFDEGDGPSASNPWQRPDPRLGNGRWRNPGESEPTGGTRTQTSKPCPPSESPTKPTESPTQPTEPPGDPGPTPPQGFPGGGGGGGATEPLPQFRPPKVPDMQLPGELQPNPPGLPGTPPVIDAGAGAVAAAAPIGAAVPIALPVIVAPPLGLGIGAGAGSGSAGVGAGLPAAPRGVPAQPPAARSPQPANAGSNAAVPNASYRIGYNEYLRAAALPQVAALAVPGFVGILVLTGAGGLVGYRQAKAGHAVRVGGSARFMR